MNIEEIVEQIEDIRYLANSPAERDKLKSEFIKNFNEEYMVVERSSKQEQMKSFCLSYPFEAEVQNKTEAELREQFDGDYVLTCASSTSGISEEELIDYAVGFFCH